MAAARVRPHRRPLRPTAVAADVTAIEHDPTPIAYNPGGEAQSRGTAGTVGTAGTAGTAGAVGVMLVWPTATDRANLAYAIKSNRRRHRRGHCR
jgi:hypothetical protein